MIPWGHKICAIWGPPVVQTYNNLRIAYLITDRSGEVRKFMDQESLKKEANVCTIVYQMI